jgi:hypothetical protein
MLVLFYVDDVIYASPNGKDLDNFESAMKATFKLKLLGRPTKMTGFGIEWGEKGNAVSLHQRGYTDDVIHRFATAKPRYTPLPIDYDAKEAEESTPLSKQDLQLYMQIVGSINYLATITRPDLSAAVTKLSSRLSCATEYHLSAAYFLLGYVTHTKGCKLTYKHGPPCLRAFTDASFAQDRAKGKSTSGFIATALGTPIMWHSKTQSVVATSTAEAEYIAACQAAKEISYLRELDHFMSTPLGTTLMPNEDKGVTLFVDNQAAIKMAENSAPSKRTRHIRVSYHYVKEQIDKGKLKLQYIGTKEMLADALTKIMPGPATRSFREQIFNRL